MHPLHFCGVIETYWIVGGGVFFLNRFRWNQASSQSWWLSRLVVLWLERWKCASAVGTGPYFSFDLARQPNRSWIGKTNTDWSEKGALGTRNPTREHRSAQVLAVQGETMSGSHGRVAPQTRSANQPWEPSTWRVAVGIVTSDVWLHRISRVPCLVRSSLNYTSHNDSEFQPYWQGFMNCNAPKTQQLWNMKVHKILTRSHSTLCGLSRGLLRVPGNEWEPIPSARTSSQEPRATMDMSQMWGCFFFPY